VVHQVLALASAAAAEEHEAAAVEEQEDAAVEEAGEEAGGPALA
jgi:hypothetical protein